MKTLDDVVVEFEKHTDVLDEVIKATDQVSTSQAAMTNAVTLLVAQGRERHMKTSIVFLVLSLTIVACSGGGAGTGGGSGGVGGGSAGGAGGGTAGGVGGGGTAGGAGGTGGDAGSADGGATTTPQCSFAIDGQVSDLRPSSSIHVAIHEPDVVIVDARRPDGGDYPFGVTGTVGFTAATSLGDRLVFSAGDGRMFEAVTRPTWVVQQQPRCPGDWFVASFSGSLVDKQSGSTVNLSDGLIAGQVCYYPHGQPLPIGCVCATGSCYPDCR